MDEFAEFQETVSALIDLDADNWEDVADELLGQQEDSTVKVKEHVMQIFASMSARLSFSF